MMTENVNGEDLLNGRDFVRRRHAAPREATPQGPPSGPPPGQSPASWSTPAPYAGETSQPQQQPASNPVPGFDQTPGYDPAQQPGQQPVQPVPGEQEATPTAPLSRSFLSERTTERVETKGFRKLLGMKPRPEEIQEHEWRKSLSQHWIGPRTIAVANPKGGASKTPTTIALSALFARLGGNGVLAWDNNVTRGSLGWRTELGEGRTRRTVLDLLGVADPLMQIEARAGDLDAYVRHQSEDQFHVLASAAHLRSEEQGVTAADFDKIWRLVTKYFRVVLVDSGNEESAPIWRRMMDRSDVLVVPMANRRDHAEAAREMLQSLRSRDEHCAQLAANAVIVVSEANGPRPEYAAELRRDFETEGRTVVTIPFDSAIGDDHIRYDALAAGTQRAYLEAAAAVAARLDRVVTTGPLAGLGGDGSQSASGGWR